ncbi:MAG: hypothetical protein Unbinned664contig1000_72 [Prokaryotic dsDNA virus sp.]|nr:MAG: hypothetical protein Unbinned664contig1000_72 [Prokaryotic dsDNA virus sp.]|tara:strand:- start:20197 stop:20781 length:585 start_codon:yes stop_codon:yes gene_type:complete
MEKLIAFYDYETTGMPLWGEPSEHPDQPHAVSLGLRLVGFETRKLYHQVHMIARPDGWVIEPEASEVHGITTEEALRIGIPEKHLFETVLHYSRIADLNCAFNKSFDERITRIGLMRFGFGDDVAEEFKARDSHCAMQACRKLVGAVDTNGKGKAPTLTEAYTYFFGVPFEGAHGAFADATAAEKVYFATLDAE